MSIENQLVAVFVEEDDAESIVIGVVLNDTEDFLTVASYLRKSETGVATKEVTINKDYIQALVILDRKNEETVNVLPKGSSFCFPLIGGDQVSESSGDQAAA